MYFECSLLKRLCNLDGLGERSMNIKGRESERERERVSVVHFDQIIGALRTICLSKPSFFIPKEEKMQKGCMKERENIFKGVNMC